MHNPGIDPRATCLDTKRARHSTKGPADDSVAKIIQMVQNQSCKQNVIHPPPPPPKILRKAPVIPTEVILMDYNYIF